MLKRRAELKLKLFLKESTITVKLKKRELKSLSKSESDLSRFADDVQLVILFDNAGLATNWKGLKNHVWS